MAQKVKFTKDYTFRATGQIHVAYKKDREYRVPEAHYEAARAAGVIEEVPAPKVESKPKA